MKLQLKRSNVLVDGSAKSPEASQLDFGELAINYSADDPVIFLKDSNNQVIRISGIGLPDLGDGSGQAGTLDDRYLMLSGGTMSGNITLFANPTAAMEAATKQYVDNQVGNIDVPSATEVGTVPPNNPIEGALWWDTNDGRLYVYYTDINSSQWVPAIPETVIATATVINSDDVEYYLTGVSAPFDGDDDQLNYSTSLSYNPSTDTITSPKFNGAIVNPGAYTTTARNALTGLNAGDMIFNSSDSKLQIWNGSEWEAAGGASVSAPQIGNAVLTEQNTAGNRFTNEAFTVALTMLDDGAPVSQKGVKGKITADFETYPSTTAITSETVSTSIINNGAVTKDNTDDLDSSNQGWGAISFNVVDPTTNNIRCMMYSPDGSGSSQDDMYENSSADLKQYTGYKFNLQGSNELLYVMSAQLNRAGTHLNLWSRNSVFRGCFALDILFTGEPIRRRDNFYSTDKYIYQIDGASNSPRLYRMDKNGVAAGSKTFGNINASGDGAFAFETLSDRIFIVATAGTSSNLWYKELTDDEFDDSQWNNNSNLNPDGSIVNFRRSEVGNCIAHKNEVFLIQIDQLFKFIPGNSTPQSVSIPATPSGYRSAYCTLWEDPYGLLVLRLNCYVGTAGSDAAYFYYSSNNSGATWVADYYPAILNGMQVEYFVPDTYLYGRRQQSLLQTGSQVRKNVFTIRTQTVTITDGESLALLNVGDYVKAPGVTSQYDYARIKTITSNGDGTTDIVVSGFRDFEVGETVEATASTGSASSTRYLVINVTGAVTTTQVSDPGFTQLGPGLTQQISFPATFPTGNTPDEELPAGTTLQVEVEATNSVASDTFPSNIITPA